MDLRKIKRLHAELELEIARISAALSDKFDAEIIVSQTSDGLCVIFEEQDATGVTLDEFEEMMKRPGFDISEVETYL